MVGTVMVMARALVMALAANGAAAQLRDPTRPPPDLMATPEAAGQPGPVAAGLQSILRYPDGKIRALIDGRWVAVGERVGEARVVRITSAAVLLRSPAGEEELRLTPAVEKRVRKGQADGKAVIERRERAPKEKK